MIGGSLEPLKKLFAAQFQPDGAGYLYRHRQRAAAVRVSSQERNAFVADFERLLRRCMWAIFLCPIVVFGPLIFVGHDLDSETMRVWQFGGLVLILGVFLWLVQRAFDAPLARLRHRGAVAPKRTDAELQREAFANISYRKMGLSLAGFLLLYGVITGGRDLLAGWNLLWSAVALALAILVGVQAFRKWRFERARRSGRG